MKSLKWFLLSSRASAITLLLVVVFVYFSITQPSFLTVSNMRSVMSGITVLWIATVGVSVIMIAGGFDLSIGAMLALSGLVLAWLLTSLHLNIWLVMVLTVVAGFGFGFFNGFLVGRVKLSFLVVTLATYALYLGLTQLWAGTGGGKAASSSLLVDIGYNDLWGVPITVWLAIGATLVAAYVLQRTYFGRNIYAIGGNPEAARLAGINVGLVTAVVYGVGGLFAGVATVANVALLGSASPLVGQNTTLQAATAALLGGIALGGGVGTVGGATIGVIFLAIVNNGLSIAGLTGAWQNVAQGVLLLAAVIMDKVRNGRLERRGSTKAARAADEITPASLPAESAPQVDSLPDLVRANGFDHELVAVDGDKPPHDHLRMGKPSIVGQAEQGE